MRLVKSLIRLGKYASWSESLQGTHICPKVLFLTLWLVPLVLCRSVCFKTAMKFLELKVFITKTRLFKYIGNFTSKNWIFSDKNSDVFHISTQNIDCGYSLEPPQRGGSNEYRQSMFLSRNKKNNVYPYNPQFYYIKVGFKGVKII